MAPNTFVGTGMQPKEPDLVVYSEPENVLSCAIEGAWEMELQLSGNMKTLLMPLWGRAKATQADSRILSDPKAVGIVDKLGLNLSDFDHLLHESNELFTVARARAMDDVIRTILADEPRATVVNLGAGLDTGFYRVDNGLLRWFDVDLPEVTQLRLKLIGEGDRNKCVGASILDHDWADAVGTGVGSTIFVASGVLVYLHRSEVTGLLSKIGERFPDAEMVFDVQSHMTNFFGNRRLKAAGMGDARFRWGGPTRRRIVKSVPGARIIEEFGIFSRLQRSDFADRKSWRMGKTMDRMRTFTIMHLKLGRPAERI